MSTPREGIFVSPALSSSPDVLREPTSPIRRPSNGSDHVRRSPTLGRSFDPDARERQRTMDVDMALQLSRARRETISISPEISPMSGGVHEEDAEINRVNHLVMNDYELSRDPSGIDLATHLSQNNDPNFGAHPQAANQSMNAEPMYGLPTYQANVLSTAFDFSTLEEFATVEKASLGLSTSPAKFSIEPFRSPHPAVPAANPAQDAPEHSNEQVESFMNQLDNSPRPSTSGRHRTLSQSHPHPRTHRKGIGGKMALFETPHLGVSGIPSLTSRLGLSRQNDSPIYGTLVPGSAAPNGGILNTGHDRPYRFSFYSNALAATIHSRSLSELPAEGQSFEDLFAGNHTPEDTLKARDADRRSTTSAAFAANRPHTGDGHSNDNFNNNGARNRHSIQKVDPKSGHLVPGPPPGGGGTRNSEDSDFSTWWLDVMSPTDEEMKVLSKASPVPGLVLPLLTSYLYL